MDGDIWTAESGEGPLWNDSFAPTCQEQQVELGMPLRLSSDIANALRYMQITYYIVCFPFGVLLNLFVISLILRFKKLQTVTFILAFQVSVGDFINALIVFPTSAANAIADRYVFTGLCPVFGLILLWLRIARTYLMLVLALDRFCTVFLPFWYQRYRHRVKIVGTLSLVAWTMAFIVALVPVQGLLDCYSFQRNTWACVTSNGCIHQSECSIYNSTSIALSNICNVISLLLYFILFCKARSLRKKIVTVKMANEDPACEAMKAAAAHVQGRERRANFTFFLLILALVGVSFLPFLFFVVGRPIISTLKVVPPPGYTVAGILGRSTFPLLTIIDPIVIMRNEDFREATNKICRKLRKPAVGARGSSSNATNSNSVHISG